MANKTATQSAAAKASVTAGRAAATRKANKAAAAPVPAVAAAPVAVALRGGPAVQAVQITGKLYRSAAKHNTDWWAQVQAAAASPAGAPVAELVKAGVPTHFIGYTMRRGYLKAL